jgi:Tol biopolymer transport system component/metal-dependent hydrolase (beta-lactamase superfamily II)
MRSAALLVGTVLVHLVSCSTAGADRAVSGRIAFYSMRNGRADIYVMDAAGGNLRCLTCESGGGKCPAFSPDGSLIAFQPDWGGNEDLYVMDADGSNKRRLTEAPSSERHAAWSPDGAKIAFQTDRDGNPEIYVMDADGGNWVRLTDDPAEDMKPSWSPDGTRIVFNSKRDGNWELYVMSADGTGLRRLTYSAEWELFPVWSPDGTAIAFRSGRAGVFEGDIHVISPDGTGERGVTDDEGMEEDPAWSPDGKTIAFQSMKAGTFDIYTVDREGGDWTRLTQHAAHDYWPTWSVEAGPVASSEPGSDVVRAEDVRLRIVYDDRAMVEGLEADPGFACLVQVGEGTVLFDTGRIGRILMANVDSLGIDPAEIDDIVISHKHSDHIGGLPVLLEACRRPRVYLPEGMPDNIVGQAVVLVADAVDSARRWAEVTEVAAAVRIEEGLYTTGPMGTRIPEQSLVLSTQAGLVVITGCGHPGVVEIVEAARKLLGRDVLLVMGGFHLDGRDAEEVGAVAGRLSPLTRYVAPCHCSGDKAREEFARIFGSRYIDAGLGSSISLDELVSPVR